jgi:anti-sigma factor RsiW
MTCDMYEEQVSALIDNELNEEEAESLFRHLSTCLSCRRSLRTVLDLRSDLKEQEPPLAPAELDEKVLQRAASEKRYVGDRKPMAMRVWKRRISIPMPVAAAITIVLIAGSVALSSLWTKTQTVYVTTLPVVEVTAYFP